MRNQNQRNPLEDDAWMVGEAVVRLLGGTPREDNGVISSDLPPVRGDDLDPAQELRKQVYRALDSGKLPYLGKRKHGMVDPRAFIRWASDKGYKIPDALQFLLQSPKAESPARSGVITAETAPQMLAARYKTKRAAEAEVVKDATLMITRQGKKGHSLNHTEIADGLLKERDYSPLLRPGVLKAVKETCYNLNRPDLVKGTPKTPA